MPDRARRPAGITLFSILFLAAAVISLTVAVSLLDWGGLLEATGMGAWAPVLLLGISAACALSAVGLWKRKPWGRRLALAVLAVKLIGDFTSVFFRGDALALIGMPVVGLLMLYLLSSRAKRSEAPLP